MGQRHGWGLQSSNRRPLDPNRPQTMDRARLKRPCASSHWSMPRHASTTRNISRTNPFASRLGRLRGLRDFVAGPGSPSRCTPTQQGRARSRHSGHVISRGRGPNGVDLWRTWVLHRRPTPKPPGTRNGQGVSNVTDWARVRISSTSSAGVSGPYSASMTTITPSTSTIHRSSIWPGSWCQSVKDCSVS